MANVWAFPGCLDWSRAAGSQEPGRPVDTCQKGETLETPPQTRVRVRTLQLYLNERWGKPVCLQHTANQKPRPLRLLPVPSTDGRDNEGDNNNNKKQTCVNFTSVLSICPLSQRVAASDSPLRASSGLQL